MNCLFINSTATDGYCNEPDECICSEGYSGMYCEVGMLQFSSAGFTWLPREIVFPLNWPCTKLLLKRATTCARNMHMYTVMDLVVFCLATKASNLNNTKSNGWTY